MRSARRVFVSGHLRALVLSMLVASCVSSAVELPANQQPFVYVVLARSGDATSDRVPALLLTAATPLTSPYRSAQRFEMWRHSDGVPFRWREILPAGPSPTSSYFDGTAYAGVPGNYLLPTTGTGVTLGAADLAPGEQYDLLIETGGYTIQGHTTLPGAITPRVVEGENGPQITWNRVAGAAAYIVAAGSVPVVLGDTMFVIPPDLIAGAGPGAVNIVVTAADTNLWQYFTGRAARRAGTDEGYGLFGAMSQASVRVP